MQKGWLFDFKPLRVVAKVDEEVKVEQARLCMILNLWCDSLFAFTDGERGRIERGRRRHC